MGALENLNSPQLPCLSTLLRSTSTSASGAQAAPRLSRSPQGPGKKISRALLPHKAGTGTAPGGRSWAPRPGSVAARESAGNPRGRAGPRSPPPRKCVGGRGSPRGTAGKPSGSTPRCEPRSRAFVPRSQRAPGRGPGDARSRVGLQPARLRASRRSASEGQPCQACSLPLFSNAQFAFNEAAKAPLPPSPAQPPPLPPHSN